MRTAQCVLAKCLVKWSANRIVTKAKQQEIAYEVKETIIEELKIAVNAKREEQTA